MAEDRKLSWWVRETMKVVTMGAGLLAAWAISKKEEKGGWFWMFFGRR